MAYAQQQAVGAEAKASSSANQEYGAVFTRRWVVELILDLVGYVDRRDLATMRAVEPACGAGAFLGPMVERLSRSCRRHGRQIGEAPSFGNNYNNRSEETIGSAVDIRHAYEEGLFGQVRPWLGYLFLLEEAPGSTRPVQVKQPFFAVDPVFIGASYKQRYEILCRRLVHGGLYDAACFVTASADPLSPIHEPSPDLSFSAFAAAIRERAAALLAIE
jgi:hypothetical protein